MHVIATAGHVDHGKSTLVRALTGIEPDRWAEERRRGMTIDLGYAWTTLPDGRQIAFVDVPGHQKFITNMLAGVGPVPAVLLVVAADEGWGRQTGEHVAALNALGVNHGVLAIARSDLGDADLAAEEARDHLAGTTLAGIEAVAVSAVSGTGLDQLRVALGRMVADLEAPDSAAVRLWVDRTFTVTGAGTVVTGTLGSGTIRVGDDLTIAPSGQGIRVRGLQALNTPVDSAAAVARVAVNLRGVKKAEVRRGDVLVTAGLWAETRTVDVRLLHAASRLPAEPILHIGSAAVTVRLRPLGGDTARLALATPLPLHVGDRALLRDPGPERVIAGVLVLDTDPPALRRRGAAARRAMHLAEMTGRPDAAGEIRRRRAVLRRQLVAAGHLDPTEIRSVPPGAVATGDWLVDADHWARWQRDLRDVVDQWADRHPLAPGMPPAAAVRHLALPDPRLLEPLVRQTSALVVDAAGVRRENARATLPPAVEAALATLVERLAEHPFAAAEAPDLAAAGITERHLATAASTGRLLRLTAGVYLLPDAPKQAIARLRDLPQPFTTSEARQALQTSRRVAIPLLELLDRLRQTTRLESGSRLVRGDAGDSY